MFETELQKFRSESAGAEQRHAELNGERRGSDNLSSTAARAHEIANQRSRSIYEYRAHTAELVYVVGVRHSEFQHFFRQISPAASRTSYTCARY